MSGAHRQLDVAVIGDGPAGSALAAACRTRGVDVVLVGGGELWEATYATWLDDLEVLPDIDGGPGADDVVAMSLPSIAVHTDRSRTLQRAYGVLDNERLRNRLRHEVEHIVDRVVGVRSGAGPGGRHRLTLAAGDSLDVRLIVDATGWPAKFARPSGSEPPAFQTAIGVVLSEPPTGELGEATWMDFRPVGSAGGARSTIGPHGVTTFCYSLPVRDGWLVEETVLAARPAVEPIALLPRLAARLGRHPDELLADATRVEYVRIPMGGARPVRDQPVTAFGAAAGYVHPATGFSVASSMRAAPRVADAVVVSLATSANANAAASAVAESVWPVSLRRTRQLHDYGLDLLLRLDDDEVRAFFGVFFDLDLDQWRSYLRLDTPPTELAGVMAKVFKGSSWSMRRQLMSGNPSAFARLLRP